MARPHSAGPLPHDQRVAALEASIAANPPREAQGGHAANAALSRAASLACLVRDEDAAGIGRYLDELDRAQLYALVVTLAATISPDEVLEDRLGWVQAIGVDLENAKHRARYAQAAEAVA